MIAVEHDPRLVEEAVLRRISGDGRERAFRAERDRIYAIDDAAEREDAFRSLHGEWFVRLGLDRPLADALEATPFVRAPERLIVAASRARKDEGAELYVPPDGGRGAATGTVVIALRPERFLDPVELSCFFRHELLHVADMLDPAFGYEPRLPPSPSGPAHDRLLHDRYRALWNALVDARLAGRGHPSPEAPRRREELARLFPDAEDAVRRFLDGGPRSHADLVSFALAGAAPGERCPLCGFPGPLEPAPPDDVIDLVGNDFASWRPSRGLCAQCAGLYRARARRSGATARATPSAAR